MNSKEENRKDRALKYLIECRKTYIYTSMIDVPIFILLWYLGYYPAFWILIALEFLGALSAAQHQIRLEKIAELR